MVSSRLRLPEYVNKNAKQIYAETIDRQLSVGRSIESIMLACIYISCKQCEIPKTLTEFIRYSDVKIKDFNNSLKAINQEFNLNLQNTRPIDLLDRYMNKLNFDYKAREYAVNLNKKVRKKGIMRGKNPKSVASAVLYITSKKKKLGISQREISHTADVVDTTIRKRYIEIIELL